MTSPEMARFRRVLYLGAAVVFVVGFGLLAPIASLKGFQGVLAAATYVCSPLVALTASVRKFRRSNGRERAMWRLFACAFGLWIAGALSMMGEAAIIGPPPVPAPPELIYFAAYICAFFGIARVSAAKASTYFMDGTLITGSASFIAWFVVLEPIFSRYTGRPLALADGLFYPASDFIVATVGILALLRKTTTLRPAVLCFTLAMLAQTVGDLFEVYQDMSGFPGPDPSFFFLVCCTLIVFGAAYPTKGDATITDARYTMAYLLAPYAPPFAAVVTVGVIAGLGRSIPPEFFGMGLVVLACVLTRQFIALKENVNLSNELASTVGELRDREAELDHLAHHDALTGLPNRRLLRSVVGNYLARPHESVAMLLADLDDFKIINDTLGHETGDALLMEVSRRFAGSVRHADMVARLGGDEFALFLPNTNEEGSLAIARRVAACFDEPFVLAGQPIKIGATIGIVFSKAAEDFDELLRQADLAMYARKHNGKGGFEVFNADMQTETIAKFDHIRVVAGD